MAPKIVDKKQKRNEIAFAALNFLHEFTMKDFSTAAFIKYLGIGKSSLYHYFESKEEILYEAFYLITLEYLKDCEKKLDKLTLTFKEKLELVYDFYLVDSKENLWFRTIYVEYLKIFTDIHTPTMKEYNKALASMYQSLYRKILEDEIEKGTIKPIAINFVNQMITTADGMLLYSFSIEEFDLSKELANYIDSFIELVENK